MSQGHSQSQQSVFRIVGKDLKELWRRNPRSGSASIRLSWLTSRTLSETSRISARNSSTKMIRLKSQFGWRSSKEACSKQDQFILLSCSPRPFLSRPFPGMKSSSNLPAPFQWGTSSKRTLSSTGRSWRRPNQCYSTLSLSVTPQDLTTSTLKRRNFSSGAKWFCRRCKRLQKSATTSWTMPWSDGTSHWRVPSTARPRTLKVFHLQS